MTNHDSLLKAMAEVTGHALDGKIVHVTVIDVDAGQFLALRDRYDSEVHQNGHYKWVTAVVYESPFGNDVKVTYHLADGESLEPAPVPTSDEMSEDPRDERFDREAGFYEGWKGPGDAA